MYSPLPPDDDQPFLVSTGHLAAPPLVEALVKAAYQRYKGLDAVSYTHLTLPTKA